MKNKIVDLSLSYTEVYLILSLLEQQIDSGDQEKDIVRLYNKIKELLN